MAYTKKMLVIIKTISHLRIVTGKKRLAHTSVEKYSVNFSSDKKPIPRQSWYNTKSRPEWRDIRKAIDGNLSPDHPLEQEIATYCNDDKTGLFTNKISQLVNETEKLKIELEEERKKYQEFIKRSRCEQYEEIHFRTNFEHWKKLAENLNKEHQLDTKTIQNYQLEIIKLRDENKKLRKTFTLMDIVENPRYQLFQPDITGFSDELNEKKLLISYQEASIKAFNQMKTTMEKKPPKYIFLIFHAFNIDIHNYISNELSFKFSESNYIFACCELTGTSRKYFYKEASKYIEPIKPKVIIIVGKKSLSDINKPLNLVELPTVINNCDIQERLYILINKLNKIQYDVILEEYDNVEIKRV